MKTACFRYPGPGRIVISRGTRGMAAGFKHYLKLAPSLELWNMRGTPEADEPGLFARMVLKPFNARQIYAELLALAHGAEPVLLCYEAPGAPCHRRVVAEWFEYKLGIKVPELAPRLQR